MPNVISRTAQAEFQHGAWLVVRTAAGRELVAPARDVSGRPGVPASDVEVATYILRHVGRVDKITYAGWFEAWGGRVLDPLDVGTQWQLFDGELSSAEHGIFPVVWMAVSSVPEVAAVMSWTERRVRAMFRHLRDWGVELPPTPAGLGFRPRHRPAVN